LKTKGIKYGFRSTVWKYSGVAGWHFVSLPETLSKEIREHLKWQEEGWGRIKAAAKIGQSDWETAIWFDTKKNTYLLPVKAEIRKKENLKTGDTKSIEIWI